MVISLCYSSSIIAKKVNLQDTGILEEKNPMKRFWILYETHSKASSLKTVVDYKGVDSLEIEIPYNAKPILLPFGCDFRNVKLSVINCVKNFDLFIVKSTPHPVNINCNQIDEGNYESIEELGKGKILLSVVDSCAWVKERIGYGYPVYRKDIFLLREGKTKMNPIQVYSDSISRPFGFYTKVKDEKIEISNIEISRSQKSTYKTTCFSIDNIYNLKLKNIAINTPESDLYGDEAIRIRNAYDVDCTNITINGSYSQKDRYGYGIGMNNVRNISFRNLKADSNWGIFGNNNVSEVYIKDSDINRFDIHCYGKNVKIQNTVFRKLYNSLTSFFGEISFDNCRFIDFQPLLIGDSHLLNTKFTAIFNNCMIECNSRKASIVNVGNSISKNIRPFLQKVNWPDLVIKNTKIVNTTDNQIFEVYKSKDKEPIQFDKTISVIGEKISMIGFKRLEISNNQKIGNIPCNIRMVNSNISVSIVP